MTEPVDSVSVVVPVYNEEASLDVFLERTLAVLASLDRPWELVLVDDGSVDASPDLIRRAAAARPGRVVGLFLQRNIGQHRALLAGFDKAQYALIVTLDADLQNPPEEIPRLVAAADAGADVVGTVRAPRRDAWSRRVLSRAGNTVASLLCGHRVRDCGCMLRAYRRDVVVAMAAHIPSRPFIPLLAAVHAVRPVEIEVAHAGRAAGRSAYPPQALFRLAVAMVGSAMQRWRQ